MLFSDKKKKKKKKQFIIQYLTEVMIVCMKLPNLNGNKEYLLLFPMMVYTFIGILFSIFQYTFIGWV